MADVMDKIRFLEEYREHPEKYLPLTGNAWKCYAKVDYGTEWYDDPWYNLGWDTGLVEGNRPYFMLCWATCGITMVTYYVSAAGIEEYREKELLELLERAGLVKALNPEKPGIKAMKFTEDDGKEFYAVNIKAGDEDGTCIKGGIMYPLAALNRHNRKKSNSK